MQAGYSCHPVQLFLQSCRGQAEGAVEAQRAITELQTTHLERQQLASHLAQLHSATHT